MRWSFRTNGNFIDFVHTDETSLAVESTIVSLHNTSRAVSWSLPEDTTRISFTIDEVKYSNIPITDIDFDGTAMDSQDDFETGIEAMFPGLAGGEGGSSAPIEMTFAELTTAIAGSTLTAGQQYIITDFATKHYIVSSLTSKPAGNPTITGTTEPLIVTAVSVNKVGKEAKSTLFPEDIIHVDFDESNWTDDISFSESGVIVTGWKGTIFHRHDTKFDNILPYDFRNVKFRRWKTSVSAWSAVTTYAANQFVTRNSAIWKSMKGSNTNNTPGTETSGFWARCIDLTFNEYWNNNESATNSIPSDPAEFDDFLTFVEAGSFVYGDYCHTNHFKPQIINVDSPVQSILLNNVFFLNQDGGQYGVLGNSFESAFNHNTSGGVFYGNEVGSNSGDNQFSTCFDNYLGNYFKNNFVYNLNDSEFVSLTTGNIFVESSMIKGGSGIANNIFAGDFLYNIMASEISGFKLKRGSAVQGKIFMGNISAGAVDFSAATIIYGDYSATIFKRQDGTLRLSYTDNSDVVTIVAANA